MIRHDRSNLAQVLILTLATLTMAQNSLVEITIYSQDVCVSQYNQTTIIGSTPGICIVVSPIAFTFSFTESDCGVTFYDDQDCSIDADSNLSPDTCYSNEQVQGFIIDCSANSGAASTPGPSSASTQGPTSTTSQSSPSSTTLSPSTSMNTVLPSVTVVIAPSSTAPTNIVPTPTTFISPTQVNSGTLVLTATPNTAPMISAASHEGAFGSNMWIAALASLFACLFVSGLLDVRKSRSDEKRGGNDARNRRDDGWKREDDWNSRRDRRRGASRSRSRRRLVDRESSRMITER